MLLSFRLFRDYEYFNYLDPIVIYSMM
uniref:Uncharacterized protein n=1 Tax=Arundo donax TaxID=35708 RepID=A0A0A8ZUD8_ARUDO